MGEFYGASHLDQAIVSARWFSVPAMNEWD